MDVRTPVWQESVRGGPGDPSLLALDGLERMRLIIERRFTPPPIYHLTGLMPTEAGPGTATFRMPASPWFQSPAGYFPTGILAWLADAPLGSAIITGLPAKKGLVTSDLTMNYLRPASVDSGQLIGRARLIHAGRSLALAEVTIEDGRGRLLGHGTTRCFLFDIPGVSDDRPEIPEPGSWQPPETPDPHERPVMGAPVDQDTWNSRSGLDVLKGLIAEELPAPPLHYLMGLTLTEGDEGTAAFQIPATGWLMSPAGTVYGGALAMVADVTLASAVQSTVPAATAFAPVDLKVNFVRPVFCDNRKLTARARVVHRGKTLCVANAEIVNEDGKPVAVATGSALILPDRPWRIAEPVVAEEEATTGDG